MKRNPKRPIISKWLKIATSRIYISYVVFFTFQSYCWSLSSRLLFWCCSMTLKSLVFKISRMQRASKTRNWGELYSPLLVGKFVSSKRWPFNRVWIFFFIVLSSENQMIDFYFQAPKGREVEDNDSFMFNDAFTAPLYRIKVRAT